MFENLRNSVFLKALLIIVLGLIFVNFLFVIVFGTGNAVYQLVNLLNLIVNILVLILIAAFFYGIYKVVKDYASPLINEISVLSPFKACPKCLKGVEKTWRVCPYCGEKVANEGA